MITGSQPRHVKRCFILLFISLVLLSNSSGWFEPKPRPKPKATLPPWDSAEPKAKHTYTPPPLVKGSPFIGIWIVPDSCDKPEALGEPLLKNREHYFGFISNYKDNDQEVKLFYKEHFGKFPYFPRNDQFSPPKNGGVPNMGNTEAHKKQAEIAIKKMIPTASKSGLAILEFDGWKPLWVRNNRGRRKLYHYQTIDACYLDSQTEPFPTHNCRNPLYITQYFEEKSFKFFLEPLQVGRSYSNKKLWGYRGFPECYNTHYGTFFRRKFHSYRRNAGCPDQEYRRNFALGQLWGNSTALFPPVELSATLERTIEGRYRTRHRVRESIKMSFAPKGHGGELGRPRWPTKENKWEWHHTGKPTRNLSIPIYVFFRNVFTPWKRIKHLSELDLVNTIGESAAQGVSGFIAWDKTNFANNRETCTQARNYLDGVMLPYLLNVSTSAKMCSKALCNSRGRCSRTKWGPKKTEFFLHLDPKRFSIKRDKKGELQVEGELSNEDINFYKDHFKCVCYGKPKLGCGISNCSLPTGACPSITPGVTERPIGKDPPVSKHEHKDQTIPPRRKMSKTWLASGVGVGSGVMVVSGLVYAFFLR